MTNNISTQPKLTPMMEQYLSIKKRLPDNTILFFRLGDFYEMFFKDAVRASEILNITLTGREAGEAGRVPMCGIPYHAFQSYVRTLLDHNLKVAVCDQIGDPKLAKGLVERKITRIVSPATYLEDEEKEKSFEYLAAIVGDDKNFAIAYLELSTGEFYVREMAADRLQSELTLLSPREVIISKTLSQGCHSRDRDNKKNSVIPAEAGIQPNSICDPLDPRFRGDDKVGQHAGLPATSFSTTKIGGSDAMFVGGGDDKKNYDDGSELLSFIKNNLNATITVYEDWIFEAGEAIHYLQEGFDFATVQSISFHDHPLAVGAAGSILYYLKDHFHSALGHLRPPVLLESTEFMVLDRQAQKSLEIVSSMSGAKATPQSVGGQGSPTLLSVIDQTLTLMGSRTLYQWLTHPLLSIEEISRRQAVLKEFSGNVPLLQALRGLFKGVKDMERTLSRLSYGVGNARDLINLKIFLLRVPEIRQILAGVKSAMVKDILPGMNHFPQIKELIEKAIVEEPPLAVKDGGIIRDGYSTALDQLRNISKNGKSWILEFEKKEIQRTGIKSLKVKYSQVFGYTIDITHSNLHLVPADYIRKQTLANAERFIIPELKEWDEKISGAEDKIKVLEYDLFNRVRERILQDLTPLQEMAKAIGVLDALASLAFTAIQKAWVSPTVVDSGELLIEGGRHPVVEAMLPSGQFVENDTFLDTAENQLIVLTGPNMAGKSTYIRQVAQLAILAQMGSFVPAKSARIGLVDRIFTRIGASDDLARGESTFMVEMIETASILQKATKRSLLILDEVGRGTSTFDGVSIAWAICEYLVQGMVKPRTLFATHYHELIQLEEHFPGIKNYTIQVKETKTGIVFLRKVVRGGSDRSYGIHVARLAGVPARVTDRANQILAILESENTEATQIIEGKKAGKGKQKQDLQPTLFEISNANHPILEEIRKLSVDGMTPIEALNKLAELKERLKG